MPATARPAPGWCCPSGSIRTGSPGRRRTGRGGQGGDVPATGSTCPPACGATSSSSASSRPPPSSLQAARSPGGRPCGGAEVAGPRGARAMERRCPSRWRSAPTTSGRSPRASPSPARVSTARWSRSVDGLPVTSAARCGLVRDALRAEDLARCGAHPRHGRLQRPGLDRRESHGSWTGRTAGPASRWPARRVSWASENAGRPGRSTCAWSGSVDAGLPRPLCNQPLFDPEGRHLGDARPDRRRDRPGGGVRRAGATSRRPAARRSTTARTCLRRARARVGRR